MDNEKKTEPKQEVCPHCDGMGYENDNSYEGYQGGCTPNTCGRCRGTGMVEVDCG